MVWGPGLSSGDLHVVGSIPARSCDLPYHRASVNLKRTNICDCDECTNLQMHGAWAEIDRGTDPPKTTVTIIDFRTWDVLGDMACICHGFGNALPGCYFSDMM